MNLEPPKTSVERRSNGLRADFVVTYEYFWTHLFVNGIDTQNYDLPTNGHFDDAIACSWNLSLTLCSDIAGGES